MRDNQAHSFDNNCQNILTHSFDNNSFDNHVRNVHFI
jgi:hypothetical protein